MVMWSRAYQSRVILAWLIRLLVLLLVTVWLSACASNSTRYSAGSTAVQPPVIPALPSSARQPKRSSVCLPTCIENLNSEREISLKRLKDIGLQD